MRRSCFVAYLLLFCWGLVPAIARADPAAQARFHDELAREHYKAARFEQALREFFIEQRISPNPRIAFNIALCFQALKRREEAFQFLEEYLASADADPVRRAYAEHVAGELKQSLALVRVESTPGGGAIYVDRHELGSYGVTPRVVALTPGEHEIWVELDGYRTASAKIVARQADQVELTLAPSRIVGRLKVSSPVIGQIAVRGPSGDMAGQGAPPLEVSLPPGNYEVNVLSPGYLPWTGIARVEADKDALVAALPLKAPKPTGSITVTSNVSGALVELNGEPAGFSPTVLSNVNIGPQRLRLVSPKLLPWNGTIDVAANERTWLTVSLEEPPTMRTSPATWVAGGISAAALATGGLLGILSVQAHSDFENASTSADRSAMRERGVTLNIATDVALVTAAVGAVTAGILYFTTTEARGRPSSASMARGQK
jgi:outer membrane receptor for ferrienterochelin and colicins